MLTIKYQTALNINRKEKLSHVSARDCPFCSIYQSDIIITKTIIFTQTGGTPVQSRYRYSRMSNFADHLRAMEDLHSTETRCFSVFTINIAPYIQSGYMEFFILK